MARGRRKKIPTTSRRYPFVLIFAIFAVIVLAFWLWLIPERSAQGNQTSSSLGEDTLTSCPDTSVIMHGPQDKKEIALTFDADMTFGMDRDLHTHAVKSYIDRKLIDILLQTQTPATMFLTGLWIKDYPVETRFLANNSLFELGNHSYSHPTFDGVCYGLPQMGPLTMEDEIDVTQELLKKYTGVDNKYFRFPGGCVSSRALNYLRSEGIETVHWDTVGGDGFNYNTDQIVHNVIDHVQNGSIIVLHMNGAPNDPKTAEALPEIIATLKNRGYTFVKVSDLLE